MKHTELVDDLVTRDGDDGFFGDEGFQAIGSGTHAISIDKLLHRLDQKGIVLRGRSTIIVLTFRRIWSLEGRRDSGRTEHLVDDSDDLVDRSLTHAN
jgi:hypothetical protein